MPRGIKKTEEVTDKPKAVRRPAAKKVAKKAVEEDFEVYDDESESSSIDEPVSFNENVFKTANHAPTVFIKNTNLKSTDCDRLHLAQAINNFTLRTDQFMDEMKNFEKFKESIARLDILIESKKKEYDETITGLEGECLAKSRHFDTEFKDKVKRMELEYKESAKHSDSNYKEKNKQLDDNYREKNKQLDYDYKEKNKQLDATYKDKSKQLQTEFEDSRKSITNTLEDSKIDTKRKVMEDKNKYCKMYAEELKMMYIRDDEYNTLNNKIAKAVKDHEDLYKTFDKQCDVFKADEVRRHNTILKSERDTLDLTHKATNATLVAQLEQQKNEIVSLNTLLAGMKHELSEQRELTKEIAKSASKAQINQTLGKS